MQDFPNDVSIHHYPRLMRWQTVLGIILFRVVNALTITTFFQPDEYFQTYEPAHHAVFGTGFLTWEWKMGLRGSLIPLIFEQIFRLSTLLGVNLVVLSKVFMGFVAAAGDIFTYKLALKLGESQRVARWALLTSLCSFFNWFVSTRPFSNTFEMVLTTIALTYWPTKLENWAPFILASVVAQLSIVLRPTNGTLWVLMGLQLLLNSKKKLQIIIVSAGLAMLIHGINFWLDKWYYGFDVWPLYSFVMANIGQGVSHYYGVMPWHFYFTSAIPMMLMGYLPVTVYGLYRGASNPLALRIIISQLIIYSCLAHKEIRFIYYLLPLLHIVFARTVLRARWQRFFSVFVLVNSLVALYMGHIHQRGVLDVAKYIQATPEIREVTFLMPCHSVPGYAHFHREEPLDIQVLGCDPPIVVPANERATYVDEADQFYLNPSDFLEEHPNKLTKFVVAYDSLNNYAPSALTGYKEVGRFFNSHFNEWRRQGDVVVYERDSVSE